MDRSEPALMPEWLWNSGSTGGSRNNQSPSRLPSEDHSGSKHSRHRFSGGSNERNSGRLFVSDRTTPSNLRRSASVKDSRQLRSRGSFTGHSRVREWDDRHDFRDRDKPVLGKNRYFEYDDCLTGVLPVKSNKDILRPSKSVAVRKSDGTLPRKVSGDLNDDCSRKHINSSALLLSGGSMAGTALGKDFPSLRPEKEQVSSELRRTPSPGLAAALTSIQSTSSTMIGTEGWTSSLAEVPGPIGSNSTGNLSSPRPVSAGSAPLAQRANGLNMAEAVAQTPTRARTPPQLSVDTQRREELAIKQSRQLIPVTPTMSKPASLSSLVKSKSKIMQQSPFSRFDAAKSDASKLQVLKSSRELNGVVSSALKERGSPKNGFSSPLSQTLAGASAISAPNRKSNPVNGQNVASPDRRTVTPSMGVLEKRPHQIQSRKDFLNLIKKQSSGAAITARTDNSTSTVGKCDTPLEVGAARDTAFAVVSGNKQDLLVPNLPVENGGKMTENGECVEDGGKKTTENGECCEGVNSPDFNVPPPDEKEAEFLRSLGWDESAGEDEGLTEEEIRSFYERIKTNLPSAGLQHRAVNGSFEPNSLEH